MSIEFPLLKGGSALGTLWDPTVPVELAGKTGRFSYRFLLDTGADCSMLPRTAAEVLGVDLASCSRVRMVGIEGSGIQAWRTRLTARIGGIEFPLAFLVSERSDTPYLLGRLDFFSAFSVEIDNRSHVLRLHPLEGVA